MTLSFEEQKALAYWALVRKDFKSFLKQAFRTVYPDDTFWDNWHIDAIVYQLERCIKGQENRLIINLPPRHLKSFIISVALPAFLLHLLPSTKIICVSYSDELAEILSNDFRRIVESSWYKKHFSHVRFTKVTKNRIATDQGGFRYATSVGGSLTGIGGDFIIVDDPLKAEDAQSDKLRNTNNNWSQNTLFSRLDDKEKSVMIIVMQRVHVNDLTGFVESSGFKKFAFPAIATKREVIEVSSTQQHERFPGDVIHPERESSETLQSMRNQISSFHFSSQYQQRPEASDGAFFNKNWFRFTPLPPSISNGQVIVSIDSALSTSLTADHTAICVGYADSSGCYLLHMECGRFDFEILLAKSLAYKHRYPNVMFVVEAAASGISLILALRKRFCPCRHVYPKESKIVRASYVVPLLSECSVRIVSQPGRNAWVEPFMNEILSFPNGRYDDQVDAFVNFLRLAQQYYPYTIAA